MPHWIRTWEHHMVLHQCMSLWFVNLKIVSRSDWPTSWALLPSSHMHTHTHVTVTCSYFALISFSCCAYPSPLLSSTTTPSPIRFSLKTGFCSQKSGLKYLETMSSRTSCRSNKPWFWCIELIIWIWPRLFHFNSMSTKGKLWTKTVSSHVAGHRCDLVETVALSQVFSSLEQCSICKPYFLFLNTVICQNRDTWSQHLANGLFLSTFQNTFVYWWRLSLGSHLSEICSDKENSLPLRNS